MISISLGLPFLPCWTYQGRNTYSLPSWKSHALVICSPPLLTPCMNLCQVLILLAPVTTEMHSLLLLDSWSSICLLHMVLQQGSPLPIQYLRQYAKRLAGLLNILAMLLGDTQAGRHINWTQLYFVAESWVSMSLKPGPLQISSQTRTISFLQRGATCRIILLGN